MLATKISGTGSYLPERAVKNEDLRQFPASAIPLIGTKTGVLERRYAAEGEYTSTLAARACEVCLARARVEPGQIDAIVLATSSPDRSIPATATRVQHLLKASKAFAFDVNSVCAGVPYALAIADGFIKTGRAKQVLVVAAEIYSRILNRSDFTTCPYFGDGAGAILLESAQGSDAILACSLHSDGTGSDVIQVPASGSMCPPAEVKDVKQLYFRMDGRAVYEFAITKGVEILKESADQAEISLETINHYVVHQANINIIRKIAEDLRVPLDRFVVNLHKYGNTAAASVLIALDELVTSEKYNKGDLVALAAFGGGLSWGGAILRI